MIIEDKDELQELADFLGEQLEILNEAQQENQIDILLHDLNVDRNGERK